MIVATFIDFDEQTIPDAITVPGTIAGLAVAAWLPIARPLIGNPDSFPPFGVQIEPLQLASPNAWPGWLNGLAGLALTLLGFWAWWLAVLPWTWTTRRGLGKAVRYFVVSVARRITWVLVLIAALGSTGIFGVWLVGGANWESLLSAVAGVTFGGGLIWAVRIIGTRALGQEAMGFGDVTLMAMIGAFTGWQATLVVFFLAPFAAVIISVSQWLLTGRKDIAFGPYLSLATVYLVLAWRDLWNDSVQPIFSLGWFVPSMALVCLVLMGGMLAALRRFREWRESSLAETVAAGPDLGEGSQPPAPPPPSGSDELPAPVRDPDISA